MSLLVLDGVTKAFGGLLACDQVSYAFPSQGITSFIGTNGAGKSTLLHLMAGYYLPDRGRVLLGERDISLWGPGRRCRGGISRTFQFEAAVPGLTVQDNVLLGLSQHYRTPVYSTILRLPSARREHAAMQRRALQALERVGLAEFAGAEIDGLSYGMTKLMAVARATVGEPRILLLDEPAAGLNSVELEGLSRLLRSLAEHMAIILVEHNFRFVGGVADQVLVMHQGRVVFTGGAQAALNDNLVMKFFTGREPHAADDQRT